MPKRVKIKCKGCGHSYYFTVDETILNTKKLKVEACNFCSEPTRKKAFERVRKRHCPPKKVRIDGITIIAEAKPPDLKKYKQTKTIN